MSADVHDVKCSRTRRHEVRPLQLRHSLWKAVAGSQHDTAGRIETAHQRRQCNCRPYAATAIAAALEAVAGCDDEGIGIGHPASELADIVWFDSTFGGSFLQRPVVRS